VGSLHGNFGCHIETGTAVKNKGTSAVDSIFFGPESSFSGSLDNKKKQAEGGGRNPRQQPV